MKKVLALLLCAMLCALQLVPALAETASFTIETPLLAADYEAHFLKCAAALGNADLKIEWITPEEGENVRLCTMDGVVLGIGYTKLDDNVNQLVFTCNGQFDDATVQLIQAIFLYLACPLVDPEAKDLQAAAQIVNEGLIMPFFGGKMLQEPVEFGGVPAMATGENNADGTVTFNFVMDFIPEEMDLSEVAK